MVNEFIATYNYIHNIGNEFYFQTNYKAPLGKIIKLNIDKPEFENWVDIIPEHNKNVIQKADASKYGTVILVNYMENAAEKMKIFGFDGKHLHDVEMPGYGAVPMSSGTVFDNEWFFKFQTFTDPGSVYRLDMNTYDVSILRRPKLDHLSLNISDFTTDQVWYESKDGTKVPMFLIRKKSVLPDIKKAPENPIPTILYGYGGFGVPQTPHFSLMNLIFMNNVNGMYVVANIRGGGEFGEQWHKSAVQEKR